MAPMCTNYKTTTTCNHAMAKKTTILVFTMNMVHVERIWTHRAEDRIKSESI